MKLFNADNREALKELPDNSVDSVVTDPPYALTSIKKRFGKEGSAEAQYGTDGLFQRASKGFMGKEWDAEVPSVEFWREVYRVLKPGGHILSFGGTRTYHRMVVNIEDAGFEIRDQIMWIYGSGFPKSLNIGKAVDKIEGNEREVVGDKQYKSINTKTTDIFLDDFSSQNRIQLKNTKGQTEYEGWGSSIKPANEPIVLARKPLSEKSIAENVMRWRTGGLNIDGCRVEYISESDKESAKPGSLNATGENSMFGLKSGNEQNDTGRFPANVILECCCDEVIQGDLIKGNENYKWNGTDCSEGSNTFTQRGKYTPRTERPDIHTNPDCPCYIMDEQSGTRKSCKRTSKYNKETEHTNTYTPPKSDYRDDNTYSDMGGASRFFYRAKVSKKERNLGLDDFEDKKLCQSGYNSDKENDIGLNKIKIYKNNHPTLKPINLLTYLCRLITPPNGVVLDPFMGSGSTGVAALLEGFDFIGMELEKDYFDIAEQRIKSYELYKKILK